MSGAYQEYARSLQPPWLRGEPWDREIEARAAPLDDLTLRARTVMLARLIQYAPEDVLGILGAERGLRRYPGEPADTYRRRVAGAWAYWRLAGTVPGVVRALRDAGYQAVVMEHFRDDRAHWAEFSVTVTPSAPLRPDVQWGAGGTWGAGRSWGFKLPAVPLLGLLDLIHEVKPAHARLRRLLFSKGQHVWGGEDQWGSGREGAASHPWGSPWGEPSVMYTSTGDASARWGENKVEVIYEMEGATPYVQND